MSPYRLTFTVVAGVLGAIAACGRAAPPSVTQTTSIVLASQAGTPALPAEAERRTTTPEGDACPNAMVLVEGEYCPNVEQHCLRWLDPKGDRYEFFRCAEYAKPATCKGKKVHKRFCIDETERVEEGSDLPLNKKSWTDATQICQASGARLCMTSEWQFACEGEERRPYAYGWERDSNACNVDVMTGLGKVGRLVDHRTPASAHPRCVSPFGVHDMAGNVDEWATVDGAPAGSREVMKGSWWLPGRHACRSFQGGHGAYYGGTETGVRCCKDAPEMR
jgi:sulfatase modifying factor 1